MSQKIGKLNNSGFSLIEVLIAISIFSIFTVSFVTGLGYNLLDSSSLKDEMVLKDDEIKKSGGSKKEKLILKAIQFEEFLSRKT